VTILLIATGSVSVALGTIWLGYPLIMAALSRAVGDDIQADHAKGALRSVSVVLATRDPFASVQARVRNLLDTDHPAALLQVVVARDVGSDVEWPEPDAFEDPRVWVLTGDAPGGKAATLNAGVRFATGEILILADAAQRFDRKTIPELVAALEDQRFGAVSGALELGRANGFSPVHWYWRLEKWLRHSEGRVHSTVGVTGAVYATRRTLWPQVPAGTLLDDVYVPMSLVLQGHRVGFTYAARAHDVRTFESNTEAARKTRTLTGVLQLLDLLPAILSASNPIRTQFVVHKLARLVTPVLLVALMAPVATMTALLARRYPTVAFVASASLLLLLIAVPGLRRRTLGLLRWSYDLQRATIVALRNGVRRNWSVWNAPK
jgi:poly-beta-1,6-N-acetyl-D-glucosamine synthase